MSGLRVGVTGPTGEIGRSLLRALDHHEAVERVVGMARSPFDPAAEGLKKVEYREGDILQRASVESLVSDVVVATVAAARAQGLLSAKEKSLASLDLSGPAQESKLRALSSSSPPSCSCTVGLPVAGLPDSARAALRSFKRSARSGRMLP